MTTPYGGFTQIPVGPTAVQVCPPLGSGESVMLYNQDVNNVVTVGTSNNVAQDASNAAPIQPLTSAVLPASRALYAIAPTGTAALVIVPEGGTLSPSPAQIAAQISALGLATLNEQINQNTAIPANISTTGTPLLNLYNLLEGRSGTIGAGSEITLGPYNISQIAYEFILTVGTTQDIAVAPVSVSFAWTDSNTGLTTDIQVYNFYAAYTGAGGDAHLVEGHGPSNADTLTVTITASSLAVAYAASLLQSSRNYLRHEWRTQNPAGAITFPTMTYISCIPAANILGSQTSPSLNSSSITYLLPFFVGTAQVWGSIAVAANAGSLLVQDTLSSLSNSVLARFKTTSGDVTPASIVLPRDQCLLEMTNSTATASTMSAGIIAQELQTS